VERPPRRSRGGVEICRAEGEAGGLGVIVSCTCRATLGRASEAKPKEARVAPRGTSLMNAAGQPHRQRGRGPTRLDVRRNRFSSSSIFVEIDFRRARFSSKSIFVELDFRRRAGSRPAVGRPSTAAAPTHSEAGCAGPARRAPSEVRWTAPNSVRCLGVQPTPARSRPDPARRSSKSIFDNDFRRQISGGCSSRPERMSTQGYAYCWRLALRVALPASAAAFRSACAANSASRAASHAGSDNRALR
jgi:hypothetical protein